MSYFYTYKDGDSQIDAEIEWEHTGIQRGIQRYRKDLMIKHPHKDGSVSYSPKSVVDTGIGNQIVNEVLHNISGEIYKLCEWSWERFSNPTREREPSWMPVFLPLEPELLAVLSIRCCFTAVDKTLLAVASELGRQVKLQAEFIRWKDYESDKAKEAKENGEYHANIYKLMLHRTKKVDERSFAKFRKKSIEFGKFDWSRETIVTGGIKLIEVLVNHGGGWFEVHSARVTKGRRQVIEKTVRLSPEAQEFISKQHERLELTRPLMLPMLVPPRPWVRDNCAQ